MSSISTGGGSGGSVAGVVKFLEGNDAVPVGPNGAGIIFTVGSGNITVTGNAGTNTETISFTGVLPIANGGTNASSMTNTDGVVYFDGTRLVTTTVGTLGQVLTSNGAGVAPTFQAIGGSKPSFLAIAATTQTVASLAGAQVVFGTIRFNNGSAFAANVFTAPATGVYQFNVGVTSTSTPTGDEFYMRINGAANASAPGAFFVSSTALSGGADTKIISVVISLTSGNTVDVFYQNMDGANSATIIDHVTLPSPLTWFSGFAL